MKIGFNCRFMHAAYLTGVERYARNLLVSMIEAGEHDEFVLFGCKDQSGAISKRSNVSFLGSCNYKSAILRQAWEQIALPRLARKARVDLLINPSNTAPLYFDRNVIVIHDLAFLEHPEWFSSGFVRLYKAVVPKAARRAEAILTVSEFSKSRIVDMLGVPHEKVHVVCQGVDPAFHPTAKGEVQRVRRKFGLNQPYVLFVGSITPRKNLSTAIAAFAIVKKKLSTPHILAVAGVNSFQFPKQGRPHPIGCGAGEDDDIRAIGYADDDDLPGLYTGADVLVYPSLYEGFGLPPVEAMACRTPVITSNCTSLPEAVGDAAIIVDPKDADEIANSILKILGNPELAGNLRERGLERAKLFNWKTTAQNALEVCRQLPAAKN